MRLLLLLTPLAAVLLAGCNFETPKKIETHDVVSAIPWPAHEETDYVLLDRRDKVTEIGRGTLIVDKNGAGQLELQLNFSSDRGTDETSVLVDAKTLRPDFVRRERHLTDENSVVEGQYDHDTEILNIKTIIDKEERTIPLRLDKANYYDNDSSLFLWRTLAFAQDYSVSYHTVLPNSRAIQLVTIRVLDQKEITVPAGTFQTWHLEIRGAEGIRQEAWYSTSPEHVLVQYDNTQQLFKLTSYTGEPGATPAATPIVTPAATAAPTRP
jgi:hypothetical protein